MPIDLLAKLHRRHYTGYTAKTGGRTMGIEREHRRALQIETAVVAAFSGLVPGLLLWLLSVGPPATLFGPGGILGAMLPPAGLGPVGMTLGLTLSIRGRVRKGSLPALHWPIEERGIMAYLPANLLLRSILLAACSIILFIPAGLLVVAFADILPFNSTDFLIFNIAYGAAVGLVVAPFVVLPALADGEPLTG